MAGTRHSRSSQLLQAGLAAAVLLLAAGGFLASSRLAREIRELVGDAFNEQQLLIARHARGLVERELELVRAEVERVAGELAAGGEDQAARAGALRRGLARLRAHGLRRLAAADLAAGTLLSCRPYRPDCTREPLAPEYVARLDRSVLGRVPVWISRPRVEGAAMILTVAAAVGDGPERILVCELDVAWLLAPLLRDVRSGRTGYAWLIDGTGTFLYHPEASYVGRSAFAARRETDPAVSYDRINSIQREQMLRGAEGMNSYVSARHRGITGEIEKLIAYTPVTVSRDPDQTWSVAVVAPAFELAERLRRTQGIQLALQLLVVAVVGLSALILILRERRWIASLEARVRQRTAELKRSEEKYRSLVESSEDYIFTLDAAHRIRSLNSYTAKFFGGRQAELLGRDYAALLPAEVAERQLALVRRVLAGGRSVRSEFRVADEGFETWINASYMPLKDDAGQVQRVLCIARDVSEQKELERNLIHTEKLASLGTLAAGFAHEINNPLGVILGFSELLLQKTEAGSQQHEDLQVVVRQGLHCKEIVDNLLSFARSEGQVTAACDLNDCVRDVVRVVRHSLEMQKIELELELADEIPPVRGDTRQLQQVFLNLITNAVAAMPAGGGLRLGTGWQRATRQATAFVRDSGAGIDPETMKHIFEPFYTTKPAGKGTGLGLFVSYGIVSRHGGTLGCTSRPARADRPGETTFTVTLPLHREG